MSSTLLRARHIREIPWRDLVALRPSERWRELLLPLPFFVTARIAFALDSLPFVLFASAYFFLAGLRVVHLFARVPTCHLPALADRLERAAPQLSKAKVY